MKGLVTLVLLGLFSSPALALNILLSNDDGYDHPNIRALYTALKAEGHHVIIAAPEADQSARGGAFFFGRATTIGHDSDPAFPDSYYLSTTEAGTCISPACKGQQVELGISATPVMAVLMGLQKLLPHPDLVIIGPNPGNNVGAINAASGTFNAASIAVQAGVPSLAVSTDLKEKNPQRVASIVVRLVRALDKARTANAPLLPKGVGLNINLPRLADLKGLRQTQIGSYVSFAAVYTDDLGKLFPQQAGKPGISFAYTPPPTADQQDDEAVWVAKGYLTISPFSNAEKPVDSSGAVRALVSLAPQTLAGASAP